MPDVNLQPAPISVSSIVTERVVDFLYDRKVDKEIQADAKKVSELIGRSRQRVWDQLGL